MDEIDYQKVLDHFVDLSQRYALGKIQHDTLNEGLKKRLSEIIAIEVRKQKRLAFRRTCAAALLLLALLGASAFYLWRTGWVKERLGVPTAPNHPVHKAKR